MVAPTIIDYLKYAAVGAAIGRPPAKIRSDVKQHASAKKNIAIVTGRASVRNGRAMLAPTIRAFFFDAAVGAAIGRPPADRRLRKQNRLQLAALQGGFDGLGDEGKVRGEGVRLFLAVVLLKGNEIHVLAV